MRIVVVGGGPVGQVVARRLANHDVTLFDRPVVKPAMSLVLSETTVTQLHALGISLQDGVELQSIHVSERAVPGSMVLSAPELGLHAFGQVMCSHDLERAFQSHQPTPVDTRAVISVRARSRSQGPIVCLDDGTDVVADLVCLCDGGRSPLIDALGMAPQYRAFGRSAVLMRIEVTRPQAQRAFERFTATGPLALLPLGGARYGVVWSLAPEQADRVAVEPQILLNEIQSALGELLGTCTAITAPTVIPLIERWLDTPYRPGIAVFGNGAQTIHPVAGQGLNLALRGVSRVMEAIQDGSLADLDRCVQTGCDAWHRDRAQTRAASSLLEYAFAWNHPVRRFISGGLIASLDHHIGAKRWIAEAGMGRYA